MATRLQRYKKNNPVATMHRRWPAAGRGDAESVAPDTDQAELMAERFLGAVKVNDNDNENDRQTRTEEDGGGKTRSSKLTEEWLDEAKRRVGAITPARHSSPAALNGGNVPKFVTAIEGGQAVDRKDSHSRSARRHRGAERISEEILSRTARLQRNGSDGGGADNSRPSGDPDAADPAPHLLPPRQPSRRKPRFGDDSPDNPSGIPRRRSFRARSSPVRVTGPLPEQDNQRLLSPPKNLAESVHRRSISSNTCSQGKLSWGEGRWSASSNNSDRRSEDLPVDSDVKRINSFLRRQRVAVGKISAGDGFGKATIVLSGSSSSTSTTSSMVAAICYAWLLENSEGGGGEVVVPVVNMKRSRMLKHKQAAWLFHLLGIDASALLFANEVDVETLLSSRRLNVLVIGQDVLATNGEVGSQCTVLTDNYCENAYDLLHSPNLKKLLLAGILLDTKNLDSDAAFSTNKDAEAVRLLLVGSAPRYRHELFEQLMQDHGDDLFVEAMRRYYVKASNEENEGKIHQKAMGSARKSTAIPAQQIQRSNSMGPDRAQALVPAPGKNMESTKQKWEVDVGPASAPAQITAALETGTRVKNKKFSLSKLFGIRSK